MSPMIRWAMYLAATVAIASLFALSLSDSPSPRFYDGYINGSGYYDGRLIYERLDKQALLIERLLDRIERLEKRR